MAAPIYPEYNPTPLSIGPIRPTPLNYPNFPSHTAINWEYINSHLNLPPNFLLLTHQLLLRLLKKKETQRHWSLLVEN